MTTPQIIFKGRIVFPGLVTRETFEAAAQRIGRWNSLSPGDADSVVSEFVAVAALVDRGTTERLSALSDDDLGRELKDYRRDVSLDDYDLMNAFTYASAFTP